MNNVNIRLLTIALGFAVSATALAQGMSEIDYKAGKDQIAATYKSDKMSCDSLSGNQNDICEANAKGQEKVALAELEAKYKPSAETRYQAQVAKAEADFSVADQRCDDMAGNAKDVFIKEAKAIETAATADAEAQMKTDKANITARDKTSEARSDARNDSADARKEAATDTLAAQYVLAKETCDSYSGEAKSTCLDSAKKRFEK